MSTHHEYIGDGVALEPSVMGRLIDYAVRIDELRKSEMAESAQEEDDQR